MYSICATAINETVATLRQLLQRLQQTAVLQGPILNDRNRLEHTSNRRTIIYNDGSQYEGQTNQWNGPHGFGKYTSQHCVYIGDFEDRARSGCGKERCNLINAVSDGGYIVPRLYEGTFQDNSRHGYGKATYYNGDEYIGEWNSNEQHGYGRIVYSNGLSYEGQWQHGRPHGYGVHSLSRTDKYEGDCEKGVAHGYGTRTYVTGEVYEGEFHKGWAHGYGVFTYPFGETYEGYWINTKRNGYGKETMRSGEVLEGMWKDDVLQSFINNQLTMSPFELPPPVFPHDFTSDLTKIYAGPYFSYPGPICWPN